MPDDTPILSMPYIMPAQAQKHVTHNEALRILDVIVQLVVQDRTRTEPPATPEEGDRHIVAPGAMGLWAGQVGKLALREHHQWSFFVPLAGWKAHVLAENGVVTFDGTAWQSAAQQPLEVAQLGISAAPDGVNRLSVNAAATLLNHAGGGHQLKLNKAAAVDTASLLFQSAFSGHAEMGLAGTNEFSLKVSADGSVWSEALRSNAATGRVSLPAGALLSDGSAAAPSFSFGADVDTGIFRPAENQIGMAAGGTTRAVLTAAALQLNVPVTGVAVTQTTTDTTVGRLLKVGDYGLGLALSTYAGDVDSITVNGLYRLTTGAFSTAAPTPALGLGQILQHRQWDANTAYQTLELPGGDRFVRRKQLGVWNAFHRDFNAFNLVGPVSQTGGIPTGRVIDRGSNANGDFVRFADGTQMCWSGSLTFANANTADGSIFRSATVLWTYPAAMVSAANTVVNGSVDDVDCWLSTGPAALTACNVRIKSSITKATAINARALAIGRWF